MSFHLAQINIARMLAPLDDPRMADFVAALAPVNALADASPGFVWRFQSESGNATDVPFTEDPMVIVNMSVWESLEDLRNFAYKSHHLEVFRKRGEWSEKSASRAARALPQARSDRIFVLVLAAVSGPGTRPYFPLGFRVDTRPLNARR